MQVDVYRDLLSTSILSDTGENRADRAHVELRLPGQLIFSPF